MKRIWEYSNYFFKGQYKGPSSFTIQTRVLIQKPLPPAPWKLSYFPTPYICLEDPLSVLLYAILPSYAEWLRLAWEIAAL